VRTSFKDREAKIKDGKDRRQAGQGGGPLKEGPAKGNETQPDASRAGGVTWQAPVELREVDFTKQEHEFARLVEGPDAKTFEHIPRDAKMHGGRGGETAPEESRNLLKQAQQLASGPVLRALEEASDDLYAWASTRVANEPTLTLAGLLEDMVQYGLGDLAAEAAQLLEKHDEGKVGQARRCSVGETAWDGEGPGRALVDIDHQAWAMYDYREEVMMTEELAGLTGVVTPEVEKRQCVTKVLAAGCLLNATNQIPTMQQVEELS